MGSHEALRSKVTQVGLSEIYAPSNPLVDIVLVHGLNGDPYNTWSTERESWHSKKPEVFWPADLLPQALEDQSARILTYGYDANVTAFTDGVSKDKIHNHAEHLAARLSANRSLKKATERPIVFVCHSLGGLVVKRTLIYCQSLSHQHTERLRSIYVSTYGILFLGTPHNGSDVAKWGTLLQSICSAVLPKKFLDTSPQLVEALKTNNETLQNINRLFLEIQGRFHIYLFHESKPTDFKGTYHFIVDEDSAAPLIEGAERMGIEADHRHMTKFEDENSPGYDTVAEAIQRYAEESTATIRERWVVERRARESQRKAAAMELLGESTLTDISENSLDKQLPPPAKTPVSLGNSMISSIEVAPDLQIEVGALLVAPPGFRPNSLFFGFQIELDQLQQKLSNAKRRDMGSVAVLVHGGPGSGKSHLVRQHIWTHRDAYTGGVFWVDTKSGQAMSTAFWNIAQTAALTDGTEQRNPDWDTAATFVSTVRKWFEARDDWLLVFDGISFDSGDEIDDFQKFLPDRKSGSIIYTSVDRTLEKSQRLLYPRGVKVGPLAVDDARKLLYKGLSIRHPTDEQEAKAIELVKHLECLPLAIHAIAHRLSANGKAIERYHIESYSTDKRLAEPYAGILADLQEYKHLEAVNLVYLVSFLGHHVPVAMLQLGRRALGEFSIEIKSIDREGSMKRDLETTIGILIKYGLVERTLYPYPLSNRSGTLRSEISFDTTETPDSATEHSRPESSLSSSRSIPRTIDIIRIHSVVQGFCRDELKFKAPEKFYWWLVVAVRMFCCSFHSANLKMVAQEGQGLVNDYREYETHAAKLRSHFPRHEKATHALRRAHHELAKVMGVLKTEIEKRSPNSSFDNVKAQVSVFDRTSSTSSDGPETPTSLSGVSTWTLDDDKDKMESPQQEDFAVRVGTISVMPYEGLQGRVIRYDADTDTGYESEREGFPPLTVHPLALQPELTVGNSEAHDAEGILVPNRGRRESEFLRRMILKPSKQKGHKDLGDFRPLAPEVTLSHAEARANDSRLRSNSNTGERPRPVSAGSEAEASLAAVHRLSPPGTRVGMVKPSIGPPKESPPLTYARIASVAPSSRTTSPSRGGLVRDSSRVSSDNLRGRSGNIQSSPLSNASHASGTISTPSSRGHSRHPSSAYLRSPPPHVQEFDPTTYLRSLDTRELEATSARRSSGMPILYQQQDIPSLSNIPLSAPLPTSATLPTGYASQPMSRDNSRESATSLATEPARYKPIFRPSSLINTSSSISPTYGTWSAPTSPITASGTAAPSMSRDPSGPGILVHERIVQFGDSSPVDIEDARRRTEEYNRRLLPFEQGYYRPERRQGQGPAYPVVNLIPTESSMGVLCGMVDEGVTEEEKGERQEEVLHGLGMTFGGRG